MIRSEWVGDGQDAGQQVDTRVEGATVEDFAYGATATVLKTEPRLVTVIDLVDMAGPMDEEMWRQVSVLVATFLGPGRRVPQLGAVTNETASVGSLLQGEVTRLRFMAALRDMVGQAA
jgi:hypothetical protein